MTQPDEPTSPTLTPEQLLERERSNALGIAVASVTTIENLAKLNTCGAAKMSRALWPRGAPRVVTWRLVHEAELAQLERTMANIVEKDMAVRGGTVRPETLMRMQIVQDARVRFEKASGRPELDAILERVGQPEGGRRNFGELVEVSLAVVMRTANTIVERPAPLPAAGKGVGLA